MEGSIPIKRDAYRPRLGKGKKHVGGPPGNQVPLVRTAEDIREHTACLRNCECGFEVNRRLTDYATIAYAPGTYQALEKFRIDIIVPIHLSSEANRGSIWSKKAAFSKIKNHKSQKSTTHLLLHGTYNSLYETPKSLVEVWRTSRGQWKCAATITRRGKKKLDSDNLAHSAKYVRDSIAKFFGIDDGDEGELSSRWEWKYKQEIKGIYETLISLEWRKI